MESLEGAREQSCQLLEDPETLDDVPRHMVSNYTVKSKSFLLGKVTDRLYVLQQVPQDDLNFWQNFLKFLNSTLKEKGCSREKDSNR